ncbi:MAG: tetratricopeptide repeat protein [Bdellovibrionales bacterium]
MLKFFLTLLLTLSTSCQLNVKKKRLAENYHQISVSLIKKCDHNRALRHLLKGVKLDKNNFLIRYTLAVNYFTIKDYHLAIQELKKVLKQNSKVTEARVTLARSYLEIGNVEKALEQIKVAEKDQTYPYPLKVMALKGMAHFKQADFLQARREFKEVLSVPKSENCFSSLYLGRTEMEIKNYEESEKILKRAVQTCSNEEALCSPKNYNAHFFLAQLYLHQKLKKKAAYHLKIFLKQASSKNPYLLQAKKLLKQTL